MCEQHPSFKVNSEASAGAVVGEEKQRVALHSQRLSLGESSGVMHPLGCLEGDSRVLRCFTPACFNFLDLGAVDRGLTLSLLNHDKLHIIFTSLGGML